MNHISSGNSPIIKDIKNEGIMRRFSTLQNVTNHLEMIR